MDDSISEQWKYWEKLQNEFLTPPEHGLEVLKQQVSQIRNGALLVFSLANILWFIVDYGVLRVNPLGFASLTLFTAVLILQCVAMLYHRLVTICYEVSRANYISGETYPAREMVSLLDRGHVVEEQRAPHNC